MVYYAETVNFIRLLSALLGKCSYLIVCQILYIDGKFCMCSKRTKQSTIAEAPTTECDDQHESYWTDESDDSELSVDNEMLSPSRAPGECNELTSEFDLPLEDIGVLLE